MQTSAKRKRHQHRGRVTVKVLTPRAKARRLVQRARENLAAHGGVIRIP